MIILLAYVHVFTAWLTWAAGQDMAGTVNPMIYTDMINWPCSRLLNSTSTIGCSTRQTGSGVLFLVNSQVDIDSFVEMSLDDSFALVIPYPLLTMDNIANLEKTGRVTGLLATFGTAPITNANMHQSPDENNPNHAFGLYASDPNAYVWNPQGTALAHTNFPFPIFGVEPYDTNSTIIYNNIMTAAQQNQQRQYSQYPLQAVDFSAFMWAAMDSSTCLRRGWCMPVGGMSVYSTPSLNLQADDQKPIVVLTAAMDSNSLFHDLTVGVGTALSGLVTLLTVADTLSKQPAIANGNKHVLYTAFAAEPWGFAGSKRFLQDITQPFVCTNGSRSTSCPYDNSPCSLPCVQNLDFKRINVNQIDTVIEFGSLGNGLQDTGLWAHVDDENLSGPLVQHLQSYNNQTNISLQPAYADGVHRRLPPSSAMSFLSHKSNIKAAVLTEYQSQLPSYYNSDMDDQMNQQTLSLKICGLASLVSRAVFDDIVGNSTNTTSSTLAANCTLVQNLLGCLASNFSCPFMQHYFNVSDLGRVSHYSSVYTYSNPQPQYIPRFVHSFLAQVTGSVPNRAATCSSISDCPAGQYCLLHQCTESLTTYHPAYGTGLAIDEASGSTYIVDPTQGTYTESTWDTPGLRLFLVVSRKQQYAEMVVGVLWTLLSLAVVFTSRRFVKRRFKQE